MWRRDRLRQAATSYGRGLVVRGPLIVKNGGILTVGDDVVISAEPAPSHLVVDHGAALRIGDRVTIGAGAAISCGASVRIGQDTALGAYVALMDSDFHVAGDVSARPVPRPVTIGADVRIGHRVTILPGAHIGDGATVEAGSVVAGRVPAGAHVAGNPARSGVATPGSDGGPAGVGVATLVAHTFGLDRAPANDDGPDSIPGWDSLGALELLLALEAAYAVTVDERELVAARTVADLETLVARSQPSGAATATAVRAADVVARVFALPSLPPVTARPADVPGWDSLGALELLLALESTYRISLDERRLADVRSVGDLDALVADHRR